MTELDKLIIKAKKGDAEAQHLIAFNYWAGEDFAVDYSKAMKWWKLSAKKGYGKAYFNLAMMYFNGDGVPVNLKASYKYHNLSIKKKHKYQSTSYYFLAKKFYMDGLLKKKDIKKGVKYLEMAGKKGDFSSTFQLGNMYDSKSNIFDEYGVKKDDKKAFKFYKMAADNKFIPAVAQVIAMYSNGQGVKKDYKMAIKYINLIKGSDNNDLINNTALLPDAKKSLKAMIKKMKKKYDKY